MAEIYQRKIRPQDIFPSFGATSVINKPEEGCPLRDESVIQVEKIPGAGNQALFACSADECDKTKEECSLRSPGIIIDGFSY
jgi:hypothetical protein